MAKRPRQRRKDRRQHHSRRSRWSTRHSVITGAGLVAGTALGLASPASAAAPLYLTVDNLNDPNSAGACDDNVANDCSLRQAITDANTNSGQYDYIYFQSGLTGTISLTTAAGGQIPITDEVYIFGSGPQQLTVQAAPNTRVFQVDPVNAGDRVEIDGLTLRGGNAAAEGGAIFNDDSRLRVFDAILTGNTAGTRGGAVYEAANYDNGADDVFVYVTFTDNHASDGGAIGSDGDWGTVASATFSGNSAESGYGGAVYGGSGYLIDSTLSGNQATGPGGGVSANFIYLYGSILANNTAPANADLDAPDGNASFDLVKDPGDTGIGVVPSVITGQDPQLGGLALNGGYLPNMKPAASSPVVDQSYSYAYTDERGSQRVVDNPNRANAPGGNGADIGAVELTLAEGPQATPVPPPPPPPPHKKKCKKKHKRSATSAKKKCKKKKHKRSAGPQHFHFRMPPATAQAWPDAAEHHPFRLRP
jgi:predicted outer membrane repeat protein